MTQALPGAKRRRVLFVTWDGPEYHYLESLFLPIFARLGHRGFDFDVLQFTWGEGSRRLEVQAAAKRLGIGYEAVNVIRRPVAAGSLLSALLGAGTLRRSAEARGSDIVLARSTLPALAACLALRRLAGTRFVLDLDGLPTDERVEFGGLSATSPVARLLWRIEAQAIAKADAVTSRSGFASQVMARRGKVALTKFFRVSNSRDEGLFTPPSDEGRSAARAKLGIADGVPVIGYVGSGLTGKYRGDRLLSFHRMVRAALPETRLLVLVSEVDAAVRLVTSLAPDLLESMVIRRAPASQVPFLLGAADVGTAFIDPSPSMKAAAAVKVGEYLLCGLPTVATLGIGDVHERIGDPAILFVTDNDDTELARAARWFCGWWKGDHREHRLAARACGIAEYGLDQGANSYAAALDHALRR